MKNRAVSGALWTHHGPASVSLMLLDTLRAFDAVAHELAGITS